MGNHITQREEVICAIFSKLPWDSLEDKLNEEDEELKRQLAEAQTEDERDLIPKSTVGKIAVYFLKLFLLVNFYKPNVPSNLFCPMSLLC